MRGLVNEDTAGVIEQISDKKYDLYYSFQKENEEHTHILRRRSLLITRAAETIAFEKALKRGMNDLLRVTKYFRRHQTQFAESSP